MRKPDCDVIFKCVTIGGANGISVTWRLSKVIVPAIVFVSVLRTTALMPAIARLFAPLMQLVGLPGEAAVVFIIGILTSIYGGIGAMMALPLFSPQELTILSVMIAICHGAFMETAVVIEAGASGIILQTAQEEHYSRATLTILFVMVGICHSLFEETALFVGLDVNILVVAGGRLITAMLFAYVIGRINWKYNL